MADQLTDEQIAEFKEAFSLFDKDGDGQIATEELVTALRSLGLNVDEAEAQRLLSDATDVSSAGGAIDFTAFLSVAARKMAGGGKQTAERLAGCFDVFDDGRSGSIPAEQLRQVMTSHGDRLTEEEADAMVREADPRGEGRVEYREYVKVLTKNK
ncbi:hypothetical protein PR202_gb01642 [Eleusine coracana subsp. coracana]|uniref:EF-hand domain-containing protein n=1 Tax=Eleusine coracana subsp. coracana TaxID=191504 RepID=A0AAV5DWT8_ELECO|nr:hypothetical protein PR202_gb01642 [Eleusine coracana subsp. coracana]